MSAKDDRRPLTNSMETEPQPDQTGVPSSSPPPYSPDPGAPNFTPPPTNAPPAFTEELPPPYTPSPNASICCRVCLAAIVIPTNFRSAIIKCPSCQEATPLRPAPAGKRYMRCVCHCLLICGASSSRVVCPRTNCRRILNLQPTGSAVVTGSALSVNCIRAQCAYCNTTFVLSQHDAMNKLARCGSCRRLSYVNPELKRRRVLIYMLIGIILLVLGIGITVATLILAASGGFYIIWIGAFVSGILNLIRGGYIASIRVSRQVPPGTTPTA